ncbi:MAG: DUF4340 domain-containing protein [Rhodospirillales bacterium]
MTPKTLLFLAVLTIVSVAAAGVAVIERADQFTAEATGVFMFPKLADQANDVAKITVKTREETSVVEKAPDGWIMKEKGGYPVEIGKVRKLVADLAGLRLIEAMTDQPEKYGKLEVQDVEKKDSRSKLVILENAKGEKLASLIVGKLELITSHANVPGLYVRRPGEKKSWRAQGELVVPHSSPNWLVERIIDIKDKDIKSLAYKSGDAKEKPFTLTREAGDKPFTLDPKPEKGALKQDKAKDLAGALGELDLRDVRPADKVPFTTTVHHATIETFDGLVIKTEAIKLMDKYWAKFTAEAKAPADAGSGLAKRVEAINKRIKGWVYEVVDYRAEKLMTGYKTLIDEKAKAGS